MQFPACPDSNPVSSLGGRSTLIRLVATDVDGTLLNSRREIPEPVRLAVQAAQASGITICLASGRYLNTLIPIAEMLGTNGPLVTCNGSYVQDADGNPVADHQVRDQSKEAILEYASLHGVHVNIYQPREVLVSKQDEWHDVYVQRTGAACRYATATELRAARATKMIFIDSPERIQEHARHFGELQGQLDVSLTLSEPEYLEFLPGGVTKGDGLRNLAEHLGLAREEIAAIGDFYNDLEMVEWAGFGGAVANAVPELRALANVVVASNDDGGLAEFLELARTHS